LISSITPRWSARIANLRGLRHGKHGKKLQQFKNLWLPFPDDKKPRPQWFYRRALRFYKRAMRKPNAKLFIMCHHGICRSASLTYFLLRASGFSHPRAQNVVLRVRPRAVIARAYREGGEIFLAFEWANKKYSRG
jgi:protein-tyrosine phosphatase